MINQNLLKRNWEWWNWSWDWPMENEKLWVYHQQYLSRWSVSHFGVAYTQGLLWWAHAIKNFWHLKPHRQVYIISISIFCVSQQLFPDTSFVNLVNLFFFLKKALTLLCLRKFVDLNRCPSHFYLDADFISLYLISDFSCQSQNFVMIFAREGSRCFPLVNCYKDIASLLPLLAQTLCFTFHLLLSLVVNV